MSIALKMQPHSVDPVNADPDHYKIEFENDRVRVLRVRFGPHEKSVMQEQPSLLEINLTIAHLLVTYPDGRRKISTPKPDRFTYCQQPSGSLQT